MNEPRSVRYQRLRRRARSAAVLSATAALALLALTRAAPLLARRVTGPDPEAAGLVATALFAGVVLGLVALATLPAAVYLARRVDGRYGPDRPSTETAIAAHLQAVALMMPVALAAGLSIHLCARLAGGWWWLPAAALLSLGVLAGLVGAPAAVAAAARPLRNAALGERLAALAARAGVPVREVLELPADTGSTSPSAALVAGVGRSRRIFVSSELLRDWRDEEIAVVVAHELGHHAYRDLWQAAAVDAGTLTAGLALAAWATGVFGPSLGAAGAADPAALPFLGLVIVLTWLAATPFRHALSRRQERRADRFALALTGSAEAFDAAIRRLSARHLAEDRPSALARVFFHRHPPVAERLAFAERQRRAAERRATSR